MVTCEGDFLLKIAIDIDGVLGDNISPLLLNINERYDLDMKCDDIDCYDFVHEKYTFFDEIQRNFSDPEFVLTVPVISGASRAIEDLFKKYFVTIATSRKRKLCGNSTIHWLNKRFPYHNLIFTSNKTVENTKSSILIDDSIENIVNFVNSGGFGILFDQPWNRDRTFLDRIKEKWHVFFLDTEEDDDIILPKWDQVLEIVDFIRTTYNVQED